jgi:hypothetical protein
MTVRPRQSFLLVNQTFGQFTTSKVNLIVSHYRDRLMAIFDENSGMTWSCAGFTVNLTRIYGNSVEKWDRQDEGDGPDEPARLYLPWTRLRREGVIVD